jgi:RNA-binding protein Tab2/Atab2
MTDPLPIWQIDLYRRPLRDETDRVLLELVVCDASQNWSYTALCPQSQVNSQWVAQQLQRSSPPLPSKLQVFRPECESLVREAGNKLGIEVEATRRVEALKRLLAQRAKDVYPQMSGYTGEDYQPLAVYRPAPVPIPEALWGDHWRFASTPAGDIVEFFADRPIPIRSLPESLFPTNLGLASTLLLPGIVINGGRHSMKLARWLEGVNPVAINYIAGNPDGLILEAGLVDRWVLATFSDPDVAEAARLFQSRLKASKGLHFLLVQPDDSGVTYSGFWLLQPA